VLLLVANAIIFSSNIVDVPEKNALAVVLVIALVSMIGYSLKNALLTFYEQYQVSKGKKLAKDKNVGGDKLSKDTQFLRKVGEALMKSPGPQLQFGAARPSGMLFDLGQEGQDLNDQAKDLCRQLVQLRGEEVVIRLLKHICGGEDGGGPEAQALESRATSTNAGTGIAVETNTSVVPIETSTS
jgi:hypothetical protein